MSSNLINIYVRFCVMQRPAHRTVVSYSGESGLLMHHINTQHLKTKIDMSPNLADIYARFALCRGLCDQLQYFTPSCVIWVVMSKGIGEFFSAHMNIGREGGSGGALADFCRQVLTGCLLGSFAFLIAPLFQDVALHDLAVHVTPAVCIDGRRDMYQWGDRFFSQDRASEGCGGCR